MKTFKKILGNFIILATIGFGSGTFLAITENSKEKNASNERKEVAERLFQQKKKTILWEGYVDQSFRVKITSYSKKGNMYLTGEEELHGVISAKLELWPSIGSMPTLLYLDGSNSQTKRISCSTAEIL